MTQFTVVNHANEKTFVEESRTDAEQRKQAGIDEFGFAEEDLEIIQGEFVNYADMRIHNEPAATDGGNTAVVDTPDEQDLPTDPSVADDPVDWLPSHFIDSIQGVPTVNRKGYAVIASKYGVAVEAEPITLPSETDFEYAEFQATATTADGDTYSGFGSAHVDRKDGDDPHLLAELAETRAMKRATAWATGVGMTAVEELQNDL